MCFLSVIIPVYNVEEYLARCINSLINQEYFDRIELLLIDDGSNDSSGSICDSYSGKYENIKTIHKDNGGLSDARNVGIGIAKGKYLAFLDSDDYVSDTFVADMINISTNNQADIISFGYIYKLESNELKLKGDKKIQVKSQSEMIEDLIKNKIGNQICFNIYLSSLFNDVSFPLNRAYEDIATFYKLILKSRDFVTVNYSYYIYDITNENSITKRPSLKKMQDMLSSTNEQFHALKSFLGSQNSLLTYLKYNLIDKYIYIFLKVYREIGCNDETKPFLINLEKDIANLMPVFLFNYGNYSIKRYLYYVFYHRRIKKNLLSS